MTTLLESSADFTINRDEIVDLANEIAGVKGIGRVLSAEDSQRSIKLLNLIVKQWMGKSDFAPGLKEWTRKRAYLFPQLSKSDYTLGVDGDHATASYVSTALTVAASAGNLTITVSSASGVSSSMYIGIRLASGTIHWTTVNGAPAGSVITITDAIPVGASAPIGATVYSYTTKILYPLEFISLRRRNVNNSEVVINPMTLSYYEDSLLKKNSSGYPSLYLYERGTTDGTLFFNYQVSDTTEVYLLTYLRPIADFDSAIDSPDYPAEWYRPLVGQLAIDIATATGRSVTPEMKLYRDESLSIAGNLDPDKDTQDIFFMGET